MLQNFENKDYNNKNISNDVDQYKEIQKYSLKKSKTLICSNNQHITHYSILLNFDIKVKYSDILKNNLNYSINSNFRKSSLFENKNYKRGNRISKRNSYSFINPLLIKPKEIKFLHHNDQEFNKPIDKNFTPKSNKNQKNRFDN